MAIIYLGTQTFPMLVSDCPQVISVCACVCLCMCCIWHCNAFWYLQLVSDSITWCVCDCAVFDSDKHSDSYSWSMTALLTHVFDTVKHCGYLVLVNNLEYLECLCMCVCVCEKDCKIMTMYKHLCVYVFVDICRLFIIINNTKHSFHDINHTHSVHPKTDNWWRR